MEQRDDVPAELLGRSRRERGVEVSSYREKRADDVIRLEAVGFDDCPQQLIGRGENLIRIVPGHCGGPPDPMEAGWRRHG